MLQKNIVAYTCTFKNGKTYKFTAKVKTAGAFSWKVTEGVAPNCIDNKSTEARVKMFQAAKRAGYQVPQAG